MLDSIIDVLEKAGYVCYRPLETRSCFDIAAKKQGSLLLVKVFDNIDSVRDQQANNLKGLAHSLGAAVLIVGTHSKAYSLQDGIVYERYGIPVITAETLSQSVLKKMPKKHFWKGRIVAEVNPETLTGKVSEVAQALHVTKEAVYQYQHGMHVEYSKAEKLEELLGPNVLQPYDLFEIPKKVDQELSGYLKKMCDIGFEVVPVMKGFDALAKEKQDLIVDHEEGLRAAKRKVEFLREAGRFFGSQPVFILKCDAKSLKGVAVIKEKELEDKTASEVVELAEDRGE